MEPLLDTDRAAEVLGTTRGTLEVWRCTRAYDLPYVKVGTKVMYRQSDIEKFVESRVQAGTGKRRPLARTKARNGDARPEPQSTQKEKPRRRRSRAE